MSATILFPLQTAEGFFFFLVHRAGNQSIKTLLDAEGERNNERQRQRLTVSAK